MAKTLMKKQMNTTTSGNKDRIKVKRTRKSVRRDSPPQRSSIYRGVTRHRWTGRYEAHLWDKNWWNASHNKKGRQGFIEIYIFLDGFLIMVVGINPTCSNTVYLGAYDDETVAAHAYDLAALKYWGQETILNFPLSTYQGELKEMEGQSKEEYIGSLRRKSSGFSRGVSKYRGVARHHHNGKWEARIGRVFGNKYLYLGTYATQEEAATAYDMAAVEYRGLNAVTNFNLSRYIKWSRPNPEIPQQSLNTNVDVNDPVQIQEEELVLDFVHQQPQSTGSAEVLVDPSLPDDDTAASSTLELLLQSTKFKEMMEITSAADEDSLSSMVPPTTDPPQGTSFPDDVQTYFECQDLNSFAFADDILFSDFNSFATSSVFHFELDA